MHQTSGSATDRVSEHTLIEKIEYARRFPNLRRQLAVVHLTTFECLGPTLGCFIPSLIQKHVASRHVPFCTPQFFYEQFLCRSRLGQIVD